jgi:hypothetical protein
MTDSQTRTLVSSGAKSAILGASVYGFTKAQTRGGKIFFGIMSFLFIQSPFTFVAVASGWDPGSRSTRTSSGSVASSRTLAPSTPAFQPSTQSVPASTPPLPVNA